MSALVSADFLKHDGWQHATAYHWMVRCADSAEFVMVMPDLIGHDGHVMVYKTPYMEHLWSLVDARVSVRVAGFAAFAKGAHMLARRVMERAS